MREICIEILCGDVTKLTTTALVVPQYHNQKNATTLTKRLKYYGCEEGMEKFAQAAEKNLLQIGSILETVGGGNCKKLIHAMMLGTNDDQVIFDCVRAVLEYADKQQIHSLAIPLDKDCVSSVHYTAIAIVEIVRKYQKQNTTIDEVTIVVNCSGRAYERLIEAFCCERAKVPIS